MLNGWVYRVLKNILYSLLSCTIFFDDSVEILIFVRYLCNDTAIDPETQQAVGCDKETRMAKGGL